VYSGAAADLLDLSTGGAAHARRTLLDGGDLVKTRSALAVVDPVFADWLRRRFPI
jgi:hypothetical protein